MVVKDWSINVKGDTNKKIKLLEGYIQEEEQKTCSESNTIVLRKELEHLYELREDSLRQKARIMWDFKGDRNNKFFHQNIKRRLRRNGMDRIFCKGVWISNPAEIKTAFFDHFNNFFNPAPKMRLIFPGEVIEAKISKEDSLWLERPITMEEIEWTLGKMSNEKAPGPDGFNIGFLKKFWPNIKGKVYEFFQKITEGGPFPGGSNSAFITLIPKCIHPKSVSDYLLLFTTIL